MPLNDDSVSLMTSKKNFFQKGSKWTNYSNVAGTNTIEKKNGNPINSENNNNNNNNTALHF